GMEENMVSQNIVVINPSGLHMRPASVMVQIAGKCKSDITIIAGSITVNPKSILSLMAAAIKCGTEVTVSCDGENEKEDLKTIIEAIASGLGE
ncbi:MAG: HPr family phosphocarrier protein, partial [Lachnospiraceae bacterium]|nr:HPr family phosphocarrier protein [Lachnospiraceae bacterium]